MSTPHLGYLVSGLLVAGAGAGAPWWQVTRVNSSDLNAAQRGAPCDPLPSYRANNLLQSQCDQTISCSNKCLKCCSDLSIDQVMRDVFSE